MTVLRATSGIDREGVMVRRECEVCGGPDVYPRCDHREWIDREWVAIDKLGFSDLMRIAQRLLDEHYPADLPVVCHRDSPDSGARLTAALRDCMETMRDAKPA